MDAHAKVLVVRHGPGRGRDPGYLEHHLDRITADHPEVGRRIVRHHTGTPAPELEGFSAVVFWLGDPLRELYPDCYREAVTIADAARARGIRVLNPPESLSNTIKSVQARIWTGAGIETPPQYRFEDRAELEKLARRLDFPAILRGDEKHGQGCMRICRRPSKLRRIPGHEIAYPGCLTPLVDVRAGYRRTRPGSIRARYFHKKRSLVFDGRVLNHHFYFSPSPIVSLGRSTIVASRKPRWKRIGIPRREIEESVAEDIAFRERETEHADLFRAALAALGQDFAALDYSDLAGRGVVLWEANPYFDLRTPDTLALWDERRMEEQHGRIHDMFVEVFSALQRVRPEVERP